MCVPRTDGCVLCTQQRSSHHDGNTRAIPRNGEPTHKIMQTDFVILFLSLDRIQANDIWNFKNPDSSILTEGNAKDMQEKNTKNHQ